MSKTILRKALKELRHRGWYQGDYGSSPDEEGACRVCAVGAVNAAVTGDPWDDGGNAKIKAFAATLESLALAISTAETKRQKKTGAADRKRWGLCEPSAEDLLRDDISAYITVIGKWNDRKGRKQKDVEALFERLIASVGV